MGHGWRAGIQMPPLLLGGHLRVTSPLPTITAAHGAEQAACHACSQPRFSGRGLEGLRTRGKDWGKGIMGCLGIGCQYFLTEAWCTVPIASLALGRVLSAAA